MESEQKEEKRLAGFWHNLLLVRSLRRLRQDLVKLIHCLQAGGLGFESPHACADYSYACSMPKATNRGLMEANGPELGVRSNSLKTKVISCFQWLVWGLVRLSFLTLDLAILVRVQVSQPIFLLVQQ